jgi:hypothetical protein
VSEPGVSRASLEAAIRDAFHGVQLGGGISLRQAEVLDNRGSRLSDAEFAALPGQEVTDDWPAVPAEELDSEYIAHLDAEGLRYYLPAFMLRLLDDYVDGGEMWTIGTTRALDQRDRHPFGFLELLTPRQRRAIALYVRALPELVELDAEDGKALARAFRDVWAPYLAGGQD